MGAYGFATPRARGFALALVVVLEAALAAAVLAGSDEGAYAAAGLMLLFAATQASAIFAGKAGAPCACFGARSRIGWPAMGRNLALGAGFAVLPVLPDGALGTEEWLALGIAVALLACLALGVAVFALVREVGMLRLRLGPASALEISEEGPELGARTNLVESFERDARTEFAIAVFTSVGCHVCRALAPAVDSLRGEPTVTVRSFEETVDTEVWETLGIPGAPYALAMDTNGTVMAKGTFNNLAQLESIVATAERRRRERERVEALGV